MYATSNSRPVTVIHMLTTGSIEERVWETLKLKKSLFAGIFDSPAGEVSFAKLGRKATFEAVKEIFAEQPGRSKPGIDREPPRAGPIDETAAAAAGLIEAGVRFFESLSSSGRVNEQLSALIRKDERTNRMAISIPLPESLTKDRLSQALAGLARLLAGRAK